MAGMFAPVAGPRRKNDGAAVPLPQACPLRDAEGALSYWVTCCVPGAAQSRKIIAKDKGFSYPQPQESKAQTR